MKRRTVAIVSAATMLGIAVAVLAFSTGFQVGASAANASDVMQCIPSDCNIVCGINLSRILASPFYLKLRQDQERAAEIAKEISKFTEQTGIDPGRDISSLVLAGRSAEASKAQGMIIVSGDFDKSRLISFIRSKAAPIEMEYRGASVMLLPNQPDNSVKNGLTFLSDHEIALGNLASVQAALDTKAGTRKNLLSSAAIMSLLGSIDRDSMLWFVADTTGVDKRPPLPVPPSLNASSIQSIAGTIDMFEEISGKITATALDADSAVKLADAVRGIMAFGQLSRDQNPDLKLLLKTFTLTQNASQISLSFHIPGDLIKRLGQAKELPPKTI
jgi:hypothetical protein